MTGRTKRIFPKSLNEVWERLETFRKSYGENQRHPWNLMEAMEIMSVEPVWFADERSVDFLKIYQFYQPNPAQAFPGPLNNQPAPWVHAKIMLDDVMRFEDSNLKRILQS